MKFDFAISLAGNERDLARTLAEALTAEGFRVFFDEHFEHEMLGRDGADYLNDVFFRQARFCVAVLSRNYEKQAWAQLERRAAQARELHGEPGFFLPVLVEDFHPDWLLPTRIHFDLQRRGLPALVSLLKRKIASGDFGPFLIRAEFGEIYSGRPLSITAVWGADEFIVWCTWSQEAPQQLHRISKDVRTGSWHVAPFSLAERGRYIFLTSEQ